jgi:hypothetical protein
VNRLYVIIIYTFVPCFPVTFNGNGNVWLVTIEYASGEDVTLVNMHRETPSHMLENAGTGIPVHAMRAYGEESYSSTHF